LNTIGLYPTSAHQKQKVLPVGQKLWVSVSRVLVFRAGSRHLPGNAALHGYLEQPGLGAKQDSAFRIPGPACACDRARYFTQNQGKAAGSGDQNG